MNVIETTTQILYSAVDSRLFTFCGCIAPSQCLRLIKVLGQSIGLIINQSFTPARAPSLRYSGTRNDTRTLEDGSWSWSRNGACHLVECERPKHLQHSWLYRVHLL